MQFTVLSHDKSQIYLLFYKPSKTDPFQNQMVSYFNGPYCHVEMAIPEKYGDEPWEKDVWGTSIYQGESVFFKPKTYQREGYFCFAIEVTQAQRIKIKEYCRLQAEKNVQFSLMAMYLSYLPFQVIDVEGTFCSKHVTGALKSGQIEGLEHLNPVLVTPSSLYKTLLKNSMQSPIIQVIPSRMNQDSSQSSAQVLKEIIVRSC